MAEHTTDYIPRTLEKHILRLSKQYKVLILTGARQVGKSTLLKHLDKNRAYVSLDNLQLRSLANDDPELFLKRYKPPLTIDEIQYAPKLLSYIKLKVDATEQNGLFWLTGSQKFSLMKGVSESLAGRASVLELGPLSLSESQEREQEPFYPPVVKEKFEKLKTANFEIDLQETFKLILSGQMPKLLSDSTLEIENFYESYLQTYIERDIRDLNVIKKERDFLKFITMLAARVGTVLNLSSLSSDLAISSPTLKDWLSVLITSGIVYLLNPYYSNLNKRLIKAPKLYFYDTGLCCFLLGWSNAEALERGAFAGQIFENFVINQVMLSYKHNAKTTRNIYYYRDKEKREIDLLIERDGKFYPLEIKKASTSSKDMTKNFNIKEPPLEKALVLSLSSDYIPITEKADFCPYWVV